MPEPKPPPDTAAVRRETWWRLVFVLLFAVIYCLVEVVLMVAIILQFGFVLITAEPNSRLLKFSAQLSRYIYQILRFMTFNADRPFPFADWPPHSGESG